MLAKFILLTLFISFIKLSFFNSYVSTDFEVHRNWLAITKSLPISRWYYDQTSKWTLDYPPFFAWFEFCLSQIAVKVDNNITKVTKLNYQSFSTRAFQKMSIIVTDFVYVFAVYKLLCCKPVSKTLSDTLFYVLTILKLLAPFGLLLIDHIHFQYNGFLYGILFLCFYCIFRGKELWAALLFAVLLNFKHIFIYYAPAFGVFLLLHFCFEINSENENKDPNNSNKTYKFHYSKFLKLAYIVLFVFGLSFGPFIYMGQLKQVLSRLFPFDERGLTHAYWAPNFWAIYNSIDLALLKSGFLNLTNGVNQSQSMMTRGLVEKYTHKILPSIAPIQTVLLSLVFILPSLYKCKLKSSPIDFIKLTILSGWSVFQFGWHVHEKAILMVTLPFMVLESFDRSCLGIGFAINTIAGVSLLPLIPTLPEYSLKIMLLLACTCTHYVQASYSYGSDLFSFNSNTDTAIPKLIKFHLIGLPLMVLHCDWLIPFLWPKWQFLPLIIYSVYCGVGLSICYILFYLYYWTDDESWIIDRPRVIKATVTKEKKVQ